MANKQYTESQYKEYVKFMDRITIEDDIAEGFNAFLDYKQWLADNKITKEAQDQMDNRLEKECMDEMNGIKKEGKIIKFPNRNSGGSNEKAD